MVGGEGHKNGHRVMADEPAQGVEEEEGLSLVGRRPGARLGQKGLDDHTKNSVLWKRLDGTSHRLIHARECGGGLWLPFFLFAHIHHHRRRCRCQNFRLNVSAQVVAVAK
jgi:hypothetical protein